MLERFVRAYILAVALVVPFMIISLMCILGYMLVKICEVWL